MATMSSVPVIETIIDGSSVGLGRWMVVIFNNDHTSMEEVVEILMQATGCDAREAHIEMWEAHTFGKAPVHFSSKSVCSEIAQIISTVGVKTEVCPEWDD